MEICLTNDTFIEEVSTSEFNVAEINKVKNLKGGAYRQDSKAPTFCVDLSRHMDDDG